MECPFGLPVRKVMKASKSLWVYSKDDFLICKCFGHKRADYIVQAINCHEKFKKALTKISDTEDEHFQSGCGYSGSIDEIAKQALKEKE